jgi:hypothetical protein
MTIVERQVRVILALAQFPFESSASDLLTCCVQSNDESIVLDVHITYAHID